MPTPSLPRAASRRSEDLFVGISAGATVAAALRIAASGCEGGDVIPAMLLDTGERYSPRRCSRRPSDGSDDEWLASLG